MEAGEGGMRVQQRAGRMTAPPRRWPPVRTLRPSASRPQGRARGTAHGPRLVKRACGIDALLQHAAAVEGGPARVCQAHVLQVAHEVVPLTQRLVQLVLQLLAVLAQLAGQAGRALAGSRQQAGNKRAMWHPTLPSRRPPPRRVAGRGLREKKCALAPCGGRGSARKRRACSTRLHHVLTCRPSVSAMAPRAFPAGRCCTLEPGPEQNPTPGKLGGLQGTGSWGRGGRVRVRGCLLASVADWRKRHCKRVVIIVI